MALIPKAKDSIIPVAVARYWGSITSYKEAKILESYSP